MDLVAGRSIVQIVVRSWSSNLRMGLRLCLLSVWKVALRPALEIDWV